MDDALELPNAPPKLVQGDEPDENSSGDEDSGADWTKLSSCVQFLRFSYSKNFLRAMNAG